MDDNQTLSDYAAGEIRATLARRQLTGKELASKLGVSRSWISYRLTGTTEIGLNDLQRIAAALDLEIADLLPAPAQRQTGGSSGIMSYSSSHAERPARARLLAEGCTGPRGDDHLNGRADDDLSAGDIRRSSGSGPRTQRPMWRDAGVTR